MGVIGRQMINDSRRSRVQDQKTALSASGGRVTVIRGDTLYAISRRYGVPVRDLVNANRLRAPFALNVGQVLVLPSLNTHTVKAGETGYSISRRYGVNVNALMGLNGVKAPYTLAVGQRLRLPAPTSAPTRQIAVANTPPPTDTTRTPTPRAKPTGRTTKVAEPARKTINNFAWPVSGRLASRFGPKEGGLHNDGINILARQGTPVKAAEDGVVVYASNALEGYGNLLLVRHSGGWVTAYAHNERLLVQKGDRIREGQVIARVGATGGVKEPQLHFEIRKGRRALDPLQYLVRRRASSMASEIAG